ncbi:LssY C-terminal domain-containing protein [Agromyces aerolatus]|uniref:LssY C-terminal domain-containing protein n=1 Tax=Agromyces sp. LY-1074 TaxID=3074080 RepID=UPI002861893F|nr:MULTISPECIES: LssY C-terminal domain-containing protein [unclassified Agromyces]MDR5701529.1 LssY C-terminal domain-containing protein [Agromyces sp. LY-1074]MDR5707864.1 LssY C-terminal domain-containing protein [Agromyces sp. LY-1358]
MSAVGEASVAPARPARLSVNALLDGFVFVYAGLAVVWLAWLILSESFEFGWFGILFFVLFWLVLAYLVLPRLHRILTTIYVPNYFIGRARTSDGLLGDPVNLAFLGDEADLHAAMEAAGWTRADEVSLASGWRIVMSTISRRSYDEAPVSPLFLFGRKQDFAYQQEVEGNPAKRHHVRFWRTPDGWLLPGGRRVDWLAAGTFDRAVGFSLFTLQITHKIDADIDVERDHIVRTLREGEASVRVDVIEDFSTGYHSRNGGGDTIRTDGDLPVVDVRSVVESPAMAGASASVAASPGKPSTDSWGETVGKRPAFESPVVLAAPEAPPASMPRPTATALGAALIVLRVLLGIVWLLALALDWNRIVEDDFGLAPSDDDWAALSGTALTIVLVGGALVLAVQLVFAWLVFLGKNWARIAVMAIAMASITIAALDYFIGVSEITIRTTLLTLACDILVLLALSSRAARAYARRRTRPAAA